MGGKALSFYKKGKEAYPYHHQPRSSSESSNAEFWPHFASGIGHGLFGSNPANKAKAMKFQPTILKTYQYIPTKLKLVFHQKEQKFTNQKISKKFNIGVSAEHKSRYRYFEHIWENLNVCLFVFYIALSCFFSLNLRCLKTVDLEFSCFNGFLYVINI